LQFSCGKLSPHPSLCNLLVTTLWAFRHCESQIPMGYNNNPWKIVGSPLIRAITPKLYVGSRRHTIRRAGSSQKIKTEDISKRSKSNIYWYRWQSCLMVQINKVTFSASFRISAIRRIFSLLLTSPLSRLSLTMRSCCEVTRKKRVPSQIEHTRLGRWKIKRCCVARI
jgi:hypothetical protein